MASGGVVRGSAQETGLSRPPHPATKTESVLVAAQRKLTDCDAPLAKYRAALDAGSDPTIVTGWIAEVQRDRIVAQREIGLAQPAERFTKEQVRELVEGLGEFATVLTTADPKLKTQLYDELGISVTYDPTRRTARIESRPETPMSRVSVGGPIDP